MQICKSFPLIFIRNARGIPPSQENMMNPAMQDPNATVLSEPARVVSHDDSTRCLYRYGNGKRCRLVGSKPHFGRCPHHFSLTKPTASLELYNDAEDLSSALLPQLSQLSTAIALRQFLARLLVLVTQGRISPRRAAV